MATIDMNQHTSKRWIPTAADMQVMCLTSHHVLNILAGTLSLRKRYRDPETRSLVKQVTLDTMWDYIPSSIGGSAVDASVRSLIKVMMATSRWSEVRLKAMECMECKKISLNSFLGMLTPSLLFLTDTQMVIFSLARRICQNCQTVASTHFARNHLSANLVHG